MNKKIVVIGDIILDEYHLGNIKRLNPESPAPLFSINKTEYRLGGAANVAANIVGLWGDCTLIGNQGKDIRAEIIESMSENQNIDFIPMPTSSTIVKSRFIDTTYNQQLLRADQEEFIELNKKYIPQIIEAIESTDPSVIVCSDYTKWFLSKDLIQEICSTFADKKILVDTKPNKFEYYKNLHILKPNFKEFVEIIWKDIKNTDQEIEKYGKDLAQKLKSNLIITRGEQGATLITLNNWIHHYHTEAQNVFDVSGAGDTFLAGIAVKINQWESLENAVIYGNKASGVAVSKIGTSIITQEEVR
jgi:rfaE bifunctional protein kinase chain/domain